MFIGIYRGSILPGFLRWCEMDFVHPQYVRQDLFYWTSAPGLTATRSPPLEKRWGNSEEIPQPFSPDFSPQIKTRQGSTPPIWMTFPNGKHREIRFTPFPLRVAPSFGFRRVILETLDLPGDPTLQISNNSLGKRGSNSHFPSGSATKVRETCRSQLASKPRKCLQ